MNDLIKIGSFDNKETVNARELHEFLEVKTIFANWIKRRVEEYGFEKDNDFIILLKNGKNSGRPSEEYHISTDMAKELSMVERNEKGKIARTWFIERDNKLTSNESASLADPNLANIDYLARSFRVNEASKALMFEKYFKETGNTAMIKALPDYTEEPMTKPLSELLKDHGVNLSAIKANNILIDFGVLEEKERKASKGKIKKYKSLTEDGLEYGKNLISRHNQKETQPHYFVGKFSELADRFFLQ